MSNEKVALNFFLDEACSTNNKIGFQTSNAKQQSIKDSMALAQSWYDEGTIKDGSIVRIYARVSLIKEGQSASVSSVIVDGVEKKLNMSAAVDEEDIPF